MMTNNENQVNDMPDQTIYNTIIAMLCDGKSLDDLVIVDDADWLDGSPAGAVTREVALICAKQWNEPASIVDDLVTARAWLAERGFIAKKTVDTKLSITVTGSLCDYSVPDHDSEAGGYWFDGSATAVVEYGDQFAKICDISIAGWGGGWADTPESEHDQRRNATNRRGPLTLSDWEVSLRDEQVSSWTEVAEAIMADEDAAAIVRDALVDESADALDIVDLIDLSQIELPDAPPLETFVRHATEFDWSIGEDYDEDVSLEPRQFANMTCWVCSVDGRDAAAFSNKEAAEEWASEAVSIRFIARRDALNLLTCRDAGVCYMADEDTLLSF